MTDKHNDYHRISVEIFNFDAAESAILQVARIERRKSEQFTREVDRPRSTFEQLNNEERQAQRIGQRWVRCKVANDGDRREWRIE